jgi:predicted metalloprotease with PDZ domain
MFITISPSPLSLYFNVLSAHAISLIRQSGDTLKLSLIEDDEGWRRACHQREEESAEDEETQQREAASHADVGPDTNGVAATDEEVEQVEEQEGEEEVLSTVAEEDAAHSVHIQRSEAGFGFRIAGSDEDEGPIFVAGVVPGSAADTPNGLAHGDRIVAINRVSTEFTTKGKPEEGHVGVEVGGA